MAVQKRYKMVAAAAVSLALAIGIGAALTRPGTDDVTVRAAAANTTTTLPDHATALTSATTVAAEPPTTATVPRMTAATQPASTTTQAPTTTSTRRVRTTTLKPTTTTTRPSPRTFKLSSAPGQFYNEVTASGAGCVGADAGVALEIKDPSGQPITWNGQAALPDGTWHIPMRFRNDSAGRYTVNAACINSTTNAVQFRYADASINLG